MRVGFCQGGFVPHGEKVKSYHNVKYKLTRYPRAEDLQKALENHTASAHNGVVDSSCIGCARLVDKINNPKEIPPLKPVTKTMTYLFYKGRNPSKTCQGGNHSLCSGRHARNHGLIGERCSCECHLTI